MQPTAAPAPTDPPQPGAGSRSRRRRNVFGGSRHRDEYVHLIEAGWTSLAVERYAWHRYGEDIPASTIRSYCNKHGIESHQDAAFLGVDPTRVLDILGLRAELIQLQAARIGLDWAREQKEEKLLATTRHEVSLFSQLLNDHKADLQDVGVMAKAGQKVEVTAPVPAEEQAGAPRARSLAEAFGIDPADEMAVAHRLHLTLVQKVS